MGEVGVLTKRIYTFTVKELQEKLGIQGYPEKLMLWRGRSPAEEMKGASRDNDVFALECVETVGRYEMC